MSDHHAPTEVLRVVLIGDHQTMEHGELLEAMATEHGADIAAVLSFEPGEPAIRQDLTEVEAIVSALGQAIALKVPVWLPYPREDLGLEKHFRRLSLVLQRHGLNLLMGTHLTPCPTTGGMSEIDFALRSEVQAVDGLDRAALAAGGIETLANEIEQELVAAARSEQEGSPTPPVRNVWADRENGIVMSTQAGFDIMLNPPASFPGPDTPWAQREPALRRFAIELTQELGLTQAAAADCLNSIGHRTPNGYPWRQPTVSALINGRYDRGD